VDEQFYNVPVKSVQHSRFSFSNSTKPSRHDRQVSNACNIHSFHIFIKRFFKSTTTQRSSRLQHWYCVGVNTPKYYRLLWVKDVAV